MAIQPTTVHRSSGLSDCLNSISNALNWHTQFDAALESLLALKNGDGSMAQLIAAEQTLAALMSPSNPVFQELDKNNPQMNTLIQSAQTTINNFLNTFQIHVAGQYVASDYAGYDFVVVLYEPNAPDQPITFADFMKGVNSHSSQDVRVEWQDGQGDWSYVHGTMAQIYQKYESVATVQQGPGAASAAADAALQDLINAR